MTKTKKTHVKWLCATILIMITLGVAVHISMASANFMSLVTGFRSGLFINAHQEIHESGWEFSADEANGSNTLFVNMDRDNLDTFFLRSTIGSGEMMLIIYYNDISRSIELSPGDIKITAEDVPMSDFMPGRIEMQLSFVNASNVDIRTSWMIVNG